MTTVAFMIPTQRALRGGMIIGADVISLAELTQYALIIVSSASQEFEGRPRTMRNDRPRPPGVDVVGPAAGSFSP
jgi:hypothetical protein